MEMGSGKNSISEQFDFLQDSQDWAISRPNLQLGVAAKHGQVCSAYLTSLFGN
jgi:hypothetical protein